MTAQPSHQSKNDGKGAFSKDARHSRFASLAGSNTVRFVEGGATAVMQQLSGRIRTSVVVWAFRQIVRWVVLGGPPRAGWVLAVVAGPWMVKALWMGRWSPPSVAWALWLVLAVVGLLSCASSWKDLWEGSLLARWFTQRRMSSKIDHA